MRANFDDAFDGLVGGRVTSDHQSGAQNGRRSARARVLDNILEDIGRSLPFGRGPDHGFDVLLSGEEPGVGELLTNSLRSFGSGYGELQDGVRAAVQEIAVELAEGPFYLEVAFFWLEEDAEKTPVAFMLEAPPPDSIIERRGRYLQRVGERGDDLLPLPAENIIRIDLPKDLRKKAEALVTFHRAASDQTFVSTDFVTGKYGPRTGFDVMTHRTLLDDVVLTGTRSTGWTGRGSFSEKLLDPAKAWRALKLARFQIAVRDIVIAGIQRALDRAGDVIGFKTSISLSRVVTVEDIAEMEKALADGSRPISHLQHPFSRLSS